MEGDGETHLEEAICFAAALSEKHTLCGKRSYARQGFKLSIVQTPAGVNRPDVRFGSTISLLLSKLISND